MNMNDGAGRIHMGSGPGDDRPAPRPKVTVMVMLLPIVAFLCSPFALLLTFPLALLFSR
jgi:hypothetical protein